MIKNNGIFLSKVCRMSNFLLTHSKDIAVTASPGGFCLKKERGCDVNRPRSGRLF
jgi:hypothetical protein